MHINAHKATAFKEHSAYTFFMRCRQNKWWAFAAVYGGDRQAQKASTAACPRSVQPELHEGCCATLGFDIHGLHAWGLLIFLQFWIDGKFLMDHLVNLSECF